MTMRWGILGAARINRSIIPALRAAEEALVLLGAMLAPTLLVWPLRIARLGPVGAHPLVAWLLWVIAWGGRGRAGSVIGAAAGIGLLVVAPLASWLAHRRGV